MLLASLLHISEVRRRPKPGKQQLINQLKLQQFNVLKQRSCMQSFKVVVMLAFFQSELDNFKFLLQFEIPRHALQFTFQWLDIHK